MAEETSIDKLNDLQGKLDDLQVYSYEQVERFFQLYYKLEKNKEQIRDNLDLFIDSAVSDFLDRLDQDRQIDFKSNARSFVPHL